MGSLVAMQGAIDNINGLLLITPNCDKKKSFSQNYAALFKKKFPVHIVISKSDPFCSVTDIYKNTPKLNKRVTLSIMAGGDHDFESMTEHSQRNVNTAIADSVNWLNWQLKK